MSFTDQSDSDSSIVDGGKFLFDPMENQSISSARVGGGGHSKP